MNENNNIIINEVARIEQPYSVHLLKPKHEKERYLSINVHVGKSLSLSNYLDGVGIDGDTQIVSALKNECASAETKIFIKHALYNSGKPTLINETETVDYLLNNKKYIQTYDFVIIDVDTWYNEILSSNKFHNEIEMKLNKRGGDNDISMMGLTVYIDFPERLGDNIMLFGKSKWLTYTVVDNIELSEMNYSMTRHIDMSFPVKRGFYKVQTNKNK